MYLYLYVSECLSFVVSIVVCIALCYVWPTSNQKAMKGMQLGFETMASQDSFNGFDEMDLSRDGSERVDQEKVSDEIITREEQKVAAVHQHNM